MIEGEFVCPFTMETSGVRPRFLSVCRVQGVPHPCMHPAVTLVKVHAGSKQRRAERGVLNTTQTESPRQGWL